MPDGRAAYRPADVLSPRARESRSCARSWIGWSQIRRSTRGPSARPLCTAALACPGSASDSAASGSEAWDSPLLQAAAGAQPRDRHGRGTSWSRAVRRRVTHAIHAIDAQHRPGGVADGTRGDDFSGTLALSADGRYVAFVSD